jgi:DNA-binding MarR family transcriptional regulator
MSTEGTVNTGLLLYIPYRWLENRVIKALIEAGFTDLTTAQMKIMQRIGPDGTRLTELAAQAQVTKQTAGFLVNQLEKAGWVERASDPADKRARLVRITAQGQEAVPVAAAAVAEVEAEWTAYLGEQRMTELRGILNDLREITDPYSGEMR